METQSGQGTAQGGIAGKEQGPERPRRTPRLTPQMKANWQHFQRHFACPSVYLSKSQCLVKFQLLSVLSEASSVIAPNRRRLFSELLQHPLFVPALSSLPSLLTLPGALR